MSRGIGDLKREGRLYGRDTHGRGVPAAAVRRSARLAAPPRSVGAREVRGSGGDPAGRVGALPAQGTRDPSWGGREARPLPMEMPEAQSPRGPLPWSPGRGGGPRAGSEMEMAVSGTASPPSA